MGSEEYQDTLYPLVGQHLDVLQAYLYAQNTILPWIEKQGVETISESMLLEWILTIHRHIGTHLLASYEETSGKYSSSDDVARWQQGSDVFLDVADLINDVFSFDNRAQDFIKSYCSRFKESTKNCDIFVHIIRRFREESLCELKGQINPFKKNPAFVMNVIEKITTARQQGALSSEEIKALDRIVIFCMPTHEIPAAMEHFAQQTLLQWQKCKTASTKEIAAILADIFYQFTYTHPFPNANGRTATCLINIILKSLGLPDILLRRPGDRQDEKSSYLKAMECISDTRVAFAEHIYNCIEQAKHQPFQNKALAKTIELRITFALKCQELEKKYPTFDIKKFRKDVDKRISSVPLDGDKDENAITLLTECLKLTVEVEETLLSPSLAQLKMFSKSLNPLTCYNEALKYYKKGQFEQSTELFLLAIGSFIKKSGENTTEVAKCYSALASSYRDSKKFDMAIQACAKSLTCLERMGEQELTSIKAKYIQCLNLQISPPAAVYSTAVEDYKNKQFHSAICQLQYCLDKWQKESGNDSKMASCYSTIASCQRELGLFEDALMSCGQALKYCENDPVKQQTIRVKQESLFQKLPERPSKMAC